ncbi:MAG: DUF2867 domain-containing protein [Rhizobiaceae bacterium]|nr:DUF2867 domain-containing protein [Rhizobiaceae bacterium]
MARASAVAGEPLLPQPALADADWADAFEIALPLRQLTAREAALVALATPPAWMSALLALRNRIVAPFGLKGAADIQTGDTIGMFPIVEDTPARCVLGFDDTHLDFRLVVTVTPAGSGCTIRVTTVIRRHNAFGRLYLAMVMPFHKLIVPALMNRIAITR